ncbi:MAG: prepilin peptidase [Lachnospiraceae bacterium]|nr:prepilin peptidase [Lachnospiraceae bacterium]
MLCAACIQDLRCGKISNGIILCGMAGGFVRSIGMGGVGAAGMYLAQCGIYLAAAYPLYRLGMLGAGDVKLLVMTEGFFSWRDGWSYFLYMLAAAGCLAAVRLLADRSGAERLKYLISYIRDVARSGRWKLYLENGESAWLSGKYIHMAVPMLAGFLIYVGRRRLGG